MQYSEIMIRYGELSTKGKNRMRFINKAFFAIILPLYIVFIFVPAKVR